MPICVSLEFGNRESGESAVDGLRAVFERLHWESTGPSVWRYPPAARSGAIPEDWFNHVLPAMMYLRCLVLAKEVAVSAFTIDAHSQTAFRAKDSTYSGPPILPGERIELAEMERASQEGKAAAKRLSSFLDGCARLAVDRKAGTRVEGE